MAARIGFNGATFIQTWKLADLSDPIILIQDRLQWSHVHSNVETRAQFFRHDERELLQWSHVHSNVETVRNGDEMPSRHHASMEPRSFKRGNLVRLKQCLPCKKLQWSHVHSNVETARILTHSEYELASRIASGYSLGCLSCSVFYPG